MRTTRGGLTARPDTVEREADGRGGQAASRLLVFLSALVFVASAPSGLSSGGSYPRSFPSPIGPVLHFCPKEVGPASGPDPGRQPSWLCAQQVRSALPLLLLPWLVVV